MIARLRAWWLNLWDGDYARISTSEITDWRLELLRLRSGIDANVEAGNIGRGTAAILRARLRDLELAVERYCPVRDHFHEERAA